MGAIIKRIVKYLAIFFVFIILLWGVVVGAILTPEVITPQIVNMAQKYVKSEVSIKSVDLSLFTRFPNITLRIDSLRITQTKDSISDLLFAQQCRISIDPMALLSKNININRVWLHNASMYVYVDSLNGPIKTFILPETTEDPSDTTSMDMSEYTLSLKRLVIDSTQLVIDDRTREFYTRVENFGVDMTMKLNSSQVDLDVTTGFSNLIVWNAGDLLVKKTAMSLRSDMIYDMDSLKLSFNKAGLRINDIGLEAGGSIQQDTTTNGIIIDVASTLSTPSITEFLALIPPTVIDNKEQITTEGAVQFDVNVNGLYSDNSMPNVEATIKIENAKAKYASRKLSLEEVNCDAYMYLDMNTPKNSYADIRSLQVNTSEIIDLTFSGKVKNIMENPVVDMSVKSFIDFDRFSEVFPLNDGIICSGTNQSDIKMQFTLSDVQNSNYADLYIDGESLFHNLDISFDASKFDQDSSSVAYLHIQADKGHMLFGDNVLADTDSRTLRSKVNLQGLSYKSKTGEYINIKDIELTAGANFDRTTSVMNGVGVRGIAKNTDVGMEDLFSSTLESSDITIIVTPKSESRNAMLKSTIISNQITANEPNYNSEIELSYANMNLLISKLDQEETEIEQNPQRQQPQGQGQGQGQPQGQQPQGQGQGQGQSQQAQNQQSRQWSLEGTVAFSDFGMYTDLFPLEINIPQTSVSVNSSGITLDNAHLSLGSSELIASGHINNLIRKIFIDPRAAMSGDLTINASYIDFSELLEASNYSILMLEEMESDTTATTTSSITIAENSTPQNMGRATGSTNVEAGTQTSRAERTGSSAEGRVATDSTNRGGNLASNGNPQADSIAGQGGMRMGAGRERMAMGNMPVNSNMFLVPNSIEFVFDMNIEEALFESASIQNVEGRATIKDGILTLEKLNLKAIGATATGSVVYRNIDRNSSNLAADILLVGVDINRIGEIMPSIESMLPMLESFEGIVDFDMKANTNLDSDSEIDFTTLYSSMRFKGKNLVLMDSETFTDLSKTLMFKNKDRNLVDSLEVYALVEGSKIDLLPFSMSMDRYSAIIGGSQVVDPETFDVDYEYNISIMKSPLPFKAGVDITGNLEDFKFKITSAKLKKTDFDEQRGIYEEYRSSIDQLAVNLQEEVEARRLAMQERRRTQRLALEREKLRTAAEEEAIAEAEIEEDDKTANDEEQDNEDVEMAELGEAKAEEVAEL